MTIPSGREHASNWESLCNVCEVPLAVFAVLLGRTGVSVMRVHSLVVARPVPQASSPAESVFVHPLTNRASDLVAKALPFPADDSAK